MKYVYHYHAIVHLDSSQTHLDGILVLEHPIDCYTRYSEMKKMIAEWQEPPHDQTRMIICNLALLSKDDEIQP